MSTGGTRTSPSSAPSMSSSGDADDTVGGGEGPIILGRYMLCDAIGGGGMAKVHLGRVIGAAGFSRVVAIKRLHPASANDPDFTTMLVDEARLVSRIRHPNVVPTLDVVQAGRELLLVMEYVHGVSIAQLAKIAMVKKTLIPLPITVRIVLDMLAGLGAAHEAKSERGRHLEIVHRDVSPQNVILGTDGIARIVDFGIAKAEGKLSMTRDGQIEGKDAYMAPEQLRGEEHVDRRADIYATGIVLWELAAGRRLFHRRAEDLVGAVRQILTTVVERPSLHADVPPELDAIVAQALRPNPEERFLTAEAMTTALESMHMAATAKEVAAYVAELARAQLEARSAIVARVEQTSDVHDLNLKEQSIVANVPVASLLRASEPPPMPSASSNARWRWRMAVILVVLLALSSFAVTILAFRRDPIVVSVPPTPSTTAEPPPSPSAGLVDTTTVPPSASGSGVRSATTRVRPIRSSPSGSAAAPAPDCNPPYSIDSRGFRIPRRECLDH
jgi:serine/threonine protein kinase